MLLAPLAQVEFHVDNIPFLDDYVIKNVHGHAQVFSVNSTGNKNASNADGIAATQKQKQLGAATQTQKKKQPVAAEQKQTQLVAPEQTQMQESSMRTIFRGYLTATLEFDGIATYVTIAFDTYDMEAATLFVQIEVVFKEAVSLPFDMKLYVTVGGSIAVPCTQLGRVGCVTSNAFLCNSLYLEGALSFYNLKTKKLGLNFFSLLSKRIFFFLFLL